MENLIDTIDIRRLRITIKYIRLDFQNFYVCLGISLIFHIKLLQKTCTIMNKNISNILSKNKLLLDRMQNEMRNNTLKMICQGRCIPSDTVDFYKSFVNEIILGYDSIEDPKQLSQCYLLKYYFILKKFCQNVGCCLMFHNSDGSTYLVKSSKCPNPDEELAILFFYRKLEKVDDCIREQFFGFPIRNI